MKELTFDELRIGARVAIADGSTWQGERGTIVEKSSCGVLVELDGGPTHRVEWWKDVQPLEPAE